MMIHTSDAFEYYVYEHVRLKELEEDQEAEYQRHKVIYENKFLPKLFGWKYEFSCSGDLSSFLLSHPRWGDLLLTRNRLVNTQHLFDLVKYHLDNGMEFIDLDMGESIKIIKFLKSRV